MRIYRGRLGTRASAKTELAVLPARNRSYPDRYCGQPRVPDRKKDKAAGNEITIIHFNDVYQVSGVWDKNVRRGVRQNCFKMRRLF